MKTKNDLPPSKRRTKVFAAIKVLSKQGRGLVKFGDVVAMTGLTYNQARGVMRWLQKYGAIGPYKKIGYGWKILTEEIPVCPKHATPYMYEDNVRVCVRCYRERKAV